MKKIFFAAIAAALCITSCNDAASNKSSDAKQKNIAANDAIKKTFVTGNVAAIDSFIADNFVDHNDRGDFKGKDSLKAMVKFTHENMKDMKQETIHELADDDYVFSWMRWTGTSKNVPGMPDGPYDFHAMEISKFKDGKAVEHWTYVDAKEMMKMMRTSQTGMGDMKMDSTKTK
ncbi:MAG: nuclear transport factor 2 family protein [Bacteroidota bacterium]|nr:nuclear transport factor 2 family protein [Bacteroidota bacterium]